MSVAVNPRWGRCRGSDAAASSEYADWSDEELLVAYRDAADRHAFIELVQRYERELYTYLRRYLDNGTLAEDAFQTTFLQVHLKCDQFDASRKVRPWLYTIATNQAIDIQRRNKRHRMVSLDQGGRTSEEGPRGLADLLESGESRPDSQLEAAERRRQIRAAVDRLPEALRQAIILVYYQGLKYREAAEALNIPVGTVKSRVHTAISRLTENWTLPASHES